MLSRLYITIITALLRLVYFHIVISYNQIYCLTFTTIEFTGKILVQLILLITLIIQIPKIAMIGIIRFE